MAEKTYKVLQEGVVKKMAPYEEYDIGESIKLDENDPLVERGIVGTASEAKKVEKEK